MKRATQISESIELATFLAMSGGLMDAYSYLYRGQVFASQGQWATCLHYLFPVLSFALGIAICETIRLRKVQFIHWRQFTVLLEIILLCFVAFIPTDYNLVANSLTSFACGIQVQAFRKLSTYQRSQLPRKIHVVLLCDFLLYSRRHLRKSLFKLFRHSYHFGQCRLTNHCLIDYVY